MLKIDQEADAAYLTLKNTKVDKTIEISKGFFLDVDSNGDPIGVEIVDYWRILAKKY